MFWFSDCFLSLDSPNSVFNNKIYFERLVKPQLTQIVQLANRIFKDVKIMPEKMLICTEDKAAVTIYCGKENCLRTLGVKLQYTELCHK